MRECRGKEEEESIQRLRPRGESFRGDRGIGLLLSDDDDVHDDRGM